MNKELLFKLNEKSTVKDVIDILDKSGRDGLAFYHNSNKLEFVFTDGDIRRSLLDGIDLNSNINLLIKSKLKHNKVNYLSAIQGTHNNDLLDLMEKYGVRQIIMFTKENNEVIEIVHKEDLVISHDRTRIAVLIMAGGFGKRLKPFTDFMPKPMLEINKQPFLEFQIESLKKYGLKNYFISVHYLKDVIKNHFKNGENHEIRIKYLEEDAPLGTAGCISLIEELDFDQLIILNGDVYCPVDFNNLLNFHTHNKSDITMCVKEYKYQIPYGTIKTDGLNLIDINEKPFVNNFINAGIYVFKCEILKNLSYNKKIDITDFILKMLKVDKKIKCYQIMNEWIDMGTPEDYLKLKNKF